MMEKILNVRFIKEGDIIPQKKDGISLIKYIEENNGGECKITGMIGRDGVKSHLFKAFYITLGNDKIIVSYYTICGAETYKNKGIKPLPIGSEINCKKCQTRINNL